MAKEVEAQITTLDDVQAEVTAQIERDLSDKSALVLCSIMVAGLTEEAGEVAGLFKRELRNLPKDQERCTREHYVEELGDVLWYLIGVAITHGIDLQELWDYNVKKLEERYG